MNEQANPIISVIVPTFRRPDKLKRALTSINSQKQDFIEIIVIDDDPDMSAVEITKNFNNVRYIAKRGIDRGLSFSRNIGIKFSRGSFAIFLDDDDYLLPSAIDSFIASIEPSKNFYYGDFSFLRSEGPVDVCLKELKYSRLLVKNIIPSGAYMVQISSIRSNFCTTMKSHEDWDFLLSNINWSQSKYVNKRVVVIDKTETGDSSMQVRRQSFSWMEYIGIYSKFPAPDLTLDRQRALNRFHIQIPEELLSNRDTY
jgi:glycosyltransferase involved in cell wall biosynthesis